MTTNSNGHATTNKIDVLALAKDEAKTAKAAGWKFDAKTGEWTQVEGDTPKPPTPNTDWINELHAAGSSLDEAFGLGTNGKSKSGKAKAVKAPAPKAERGFVVVELRGKNGPAIVEPILKAQGGSGHSIDGQYLVVKNANAKDLVVTLFERAPKEYENRVRKLAGAKIRQLLPSVTGIDSPPVNRAITALNDKAAAGEIKGWDVEAQVDAQLRFLVTPDDKAETLTFDRLGDLQRFLGIDSTSKGPKPKATKKSASKASTSAKKATTKRATKAVAPKAKTPREDVTPRPKASQAKAAKKSAAA